MWKKLVLLVSIIIVFLFLFTAWRIFGSNTRFKEASKFLYIPSEHASFSSLLQTIKDSNYIANPGLFAFVARRMDLSEHLTAGRYEIKKGMSLYSLARMLRSGRQAPLNLVITKLRTRENLAALIGRKFECDSAEFMSFFDNNDSLQAYGFDTNTVMTAVFPDTYTLFWNASPASVFRKFKSAHDRFWNEERKAEAGKQGLSPAQAYILASIVEEETNANEEKGNIASVYLNRYRKGMKLQADPTVKFALRDFGLKRIYEKYLLVESPYNTYRNKGLPPGPICTPSLKSLDAVLNAPSTNYLYFVADSSFSGRHVFSATYSEHLKHAKEFQEALTRQEKIRDARKADSSRR